MWRESFMFFDDTINHCTCGAVTVVFPVAIASRFINAPTTAEEVTFCATTLFSELCPSVSVRWVQIMVFRENPVDRSYEVTIISEDLPEWIVGQETLRIMYTSLHHVLPEKPIADPQHIPGPRRIATVKE